jgi:glutamine amidotransferase
VDIVVIDYGIGNLRSIKRSLEEVGSKVIVTLDQKQIVEADAVVLPGVGAFQGALNSLKEVSDVVLNQIEIGKPFLGICLGLQLLFSASNEGGLYDGLDVFKGQVVKLPSNVKIPHIGWNTLEILRPKNPLLRGVRDESYVYFVHSYYSKPENYEEVICSTSYGISFPSMLCREHVFATQFHPEKSGETGLRILRNFIMYLKS